MSLKHNKNQIILLNLLINCISERSTTQILSIKVEFSFLFSNFLVIGLCNSSVNSLLSIISFLIAPPAVFLQKIYNTLKQVCVDLHHISDFLAILNALSCNILSEAVLLVTSLKSP